MTDKAECLARLSELIARSDRAELADAQAAIIEHALASPDLASRSQAMAVLQAELAETVAATSLQPMQLAYYAVIDAMIDRTRDAVMGSQGGA